MPSTTSDTCVPPPSDTRSHLWTSVELPSASPHHVIPHSVPPVCTRRLPRSLTRPPLRAPTHAPGLRGRKEELYPIPAPRGKPALREDSRAATYAWPKKKKKKKKRFFRLQSRLDSTLHQPPSFRPPFPRGPHIKQHPPPSRPCESRNRASEACPVF